MATLAKRLAAVALATAGLLGVAPAWAVGPNLNVAGSFRYNPFPYASPFGLVNPNYQVAPGLPVNQAAYNIATLGRAYRNVPPYALGYNPSGQAASYAPPSGYLGGSPYGANLTSMAPYGSGYGSPYAGSPGMAGYGSPSYGSGTGQDYASPYQQSYPDPYGGGLKGAADAIAAQGRFEVDYQKSRLLGQEVERSKVDTRRKIYDEWLYERANTPTLVDQQERIQKLEQRRALLGMPTSEVLNAYALNTLLRDLTGKGAWSGQDANGPIDPDILKQINFTTNSSAGNVGVLKGVKDGAALNWPLSLQAAAYQDEVRRLNQKASEALKLVQNTGQVDPSTLNDMKEDIRRLRAKVSGHINDASLTPSQSIEANRFLHQLSDAVTALSQADAGSYFPERLAAKAKTVPELVKYMNDKGLKFAPAVGGDEAAYNALYNYLVGYTLQGGQSGP